MIEEREEPMAAKATKLGEGMGKTALHITAAPHAKEMSAGMLLLPFTRSQVLMRKAAELICSSQ